MTPQSDNQVSTSLGNSGLCWTVFAQNRDTAVSAEGNGDLQTLICVLVARPRWCLTLSNPVPWQNWMAAYLGYTLRMKTLFCGWPVMVHDTHTRRLSWEVHIAIDGRCHDVLVSWMLVTGCWLSCSWTVAKWSVRGLQLLLIDSLMWPTTCVWAPLFHTAIQVTKAHLTVLLITCYFSVNEAKFHD